MFTLCEMTPRVTRLRRLYRDSVPTLDAERTKILTDYYKVSQNEVPVIRRARALYEILTKMTIRVEDDELIVGNPGKHFRGCCLWPEYGGLKWLENELKSGKYDERTSKTSYMTLLPEDREYLCSVADFWQENGIGARLSAAMPAECAALATTGVLQIDRGAINTQPHGHFNANYRKAVKLGFGAIRHEALEKLDALQGRIFGSDAEKYFFYKAVVISCDAIIAFTKRYAAECRRKAETAAPERRAELLEMAGSLEHIIESPARTFREAVQAVFLYHLTLNIDGQYLGLTLGRMDQHVGDYLDRDLAAGLITEPEAQEILDCFFIKVGDLFLSGPAGVSEFLGSYSNNMRMTIGGRKKDGSDATNKVSYMLLQCSARLKLHDPTLSLCVHKQTPAELWEAGLETAKINGGIPTFDNCDLIISILQSRGLKIEDARNFCIVGCVEISGSGCEFSNVSAPFSKTFISMGNVLLQAINDGKNHKGEQGGLHTGFLWEMTDFEQVKAAFRAQLEYFLDWQVTLGNLAETAGNPHCQCPIASATMDGCMESGRDMMLGGAKYNSTGGAAIGMATAIDGLLAIKHLVFDKKLCTARELYDAVMSNWEGSESLRQLALNEVTYYGNGDPAADELAAWVSDLYALRYNAYKGPRGGYRAGIYSAGIHVAFGYNTHATPNGRLAGTPVSDGISPSQGADKCGPTGVASSIAAIHPSNYGNGIQFCIKLHPTSVAGAAGNMKLRQYIETFFDEGGMQVQYNVVSSDMLRRAQSDPEEYRDLVVRVAGFSAYFVELHDGMQNDLIRRTDNAF